MSFGLRLWRNRPRCLLLRGLRHYLIIFALSVSFFGLHFHEHAVQLFHFLDALSVLFLSFFPKLLLVLLLRLPDGAGQCFGLPGRGELVDGGGVDVVRHVWRIKLPQAVTDLLLLGELEEVLKAIPLLVALVDDIVWVCLPPSLGLEDRLLGWSEISTLEQRLACPRIKSDLRAQVHGLIAWAATSPAFLPLI